MWSWAKQIGGGWNMKNNDNRTSTHILNKNINFPTTNNIKLSNCFTTFAVCLFCCFYVTCHLVRKMRGKSCFFVQWHIVAESYWRAHLPSYFVSHEIFSMIKWAHILLRCRKFGYLAVNWKILFLHGSFTP